MRKIKRITTIALIFMLIGVVVRQEAYGLRPPSSLNKAGRVIIVKTILKDAENDRINCLRVIRELEKFGYSGIFIIAGNVIRHKKSGKSILILGGYDSGKAAIPWYLIKGIKGRLNSGEWELVAHRDIPFVFLDNKPEELYVSQGPDSKNRPLAFKSVIKDKEGVMWPQLEKSDIKPRCVPVKIDGIVCLEKSDKKKTYVRESMPNTSLRAIAVKEILQIFSRSPSKYEKVSQDIILNLNNTNLPIILVTRPYKHIEPGKFENMLIRINDLMQVAIISQPDQTLVLGQGVEILKPEEGILQLMARIKEVVAANQNADSHRIVLIIDGLQHGIGKSIFTETVRSNLKIPGWPVVGSASRIESKKRIWINQEWNVIGTERDHLVFKEYPDEITIIAVYLSETDDISVLGKDDTAGLRERVLKHADFIIDWREGVRLDKDHALPELLKQISLQTDL